MAWFQIELVRKNTYRVRIDWWKPTFWIEGYRTIRAAGGSPLESTFYTLILIYQFSKRKR